MMFDSYKSENYHDSSCLNYGYNSGHAWHSHSDPSQYSYSFYYSSNHNRFLHDFYSCYDIYS